MTFENFAVLMFFGWVATEGVVEYLLGKFFDFFSVPDRYKKLIQPIASAVVGIGFAFWYKIDLIYLWLAQPYSWVGVLVTGLVVGRGANAVHEAAQLIAGWIEARI
jgi:hypothetical protein